jgi:hypothetical protein
MTPVVGGAFHVHERTPLHSPALSHFRFTPPLRTLHVRLRVQPGEGYEIGFFNPVVHGYAGPERRIGRLDIPRGMSRSLPASLK